MELEGRQLLFVVVLWLGVEAAPSQLDATTFQEGIGTGKAHFVKFYAPWCGHCKRLAPTWDELAEKLAGSVVVAKVDCTVETKLCAEQEVRGYPTLKLFYGDQVLDYRESRDIESLLQFVVSNTGPHTAGGSEPPQSTDVEVEVDDNGLAHLTDDNFDAYLGENHGIHFVKFYAPWCGHCQRLAPTWDELATHFESHPKVHISKLDCTLNSLTCQQNGVKGYPTLLLFEDGKVREKYTGNRDLQSLMQFVNDAVAPEHDQEGVIELTSHSFSQAVRKSGLTFVKFYAPWCGHCKRLAPTWDKLAEEIQHLSTSVTIAKVDCTIEKELCTEEDIHSYPTLIVYKAGQRKKEYNGSRDLDSLRQFIEDQSL